MKTKKRRKSKLSRKKKKETKKTMRESISKMKENQQELQQTIQELEADVDQQDGKMKDLKEQTSEVQNIMKTQLEEFQNLMKAQEKCLDRFYDEYDFMKKYKKDAREDVKNYMMLRNCMYHSMKSCESNETKQMLRIFMKQIDYILETKGVKILKAKKMDEYDPEIHTPASIESRVDTRHKEKHNKIARVYGCGYQFEEDSKPLQKVPVDVYIYQGIQEYLN